MSQQIINIGSAPNDGTGDQLRTSFDKCNLNFTELYDGVTASLPIGNAIQYQFNNTTSEPPAAGEIRFNNATQAATTVLWVSHTTSSGINIKQFLSAASAGARLILQDKNDNTNYLKFDVASSPVDKGTYWEFPVVVVTGGAGGNLPTASILVAVTSGAAAGNVSNVGTPTNGQLAVWTAATTIEGDAKLTWDGATFRMGDATNNGGRFRTLASGNSQFLIDAIGVDTNIVMGYSTKGSANHNFYTGAFARIQVQILDVATVDKQLQLSGGSGKASIGATGGAPVEITNASLAGAPVAVTPVSTSNDTSVPTTAWVQALLASAGFSTGDAKLTLKTTADTGWVLMNDGTIGSASSGSSTRANADTQALFTLLFNNLNDTWAPILTSAGAATTRAAQTNAATAWANNCRMTLPRQLGRSLIISGAGAGLTSRTLGSFFGSETHTQTEAEIASHRHLNSSDSAGSNGGNYVQGSTGADFDSATKYTGSSSPMDVMNPSAAWNIMIKL